MPVTTIEISVNDRSRRVAVEPLSEAPGRYRIAWDDTVRVVDAQRLDAETLSLVLVEGGSASHQVRCVSAGRPDVVDVHVGGSVLRASVDDGRTWLDGQAPGGAAAAGGGQVTAPMPGKITRHSRQPGDDAPAGQGVVASRRIVKMEKLAWARSGRRPASPTCTVRRKTPDDMRGAVAGLSVEQGS